MRRRRGRGRILGRALRLGPGLAALALAAAALAGSDTASQRRVVLVTIDTLRADHVGAAGGPVPTPALDRLAAEGVLAEQATTPVPSTGPAHASLLTGLYPWRHGTLRNAVPMDPRVPTIGDRATSAGLTTAAFVSSFILDRRFGFHQGFASYAFEPTESYFWRGKQREGFWTRGEHTTGRALQWLTDHHAESFLLWVHYFDPHRPYRPPAGFAPPPDTPVDLTGKTVPQPLTSEAQLRHAIRSYAGEVRYADAQVGRLVERLRLLDILDATTVIVTSDHGEGLGDHGVLEHGVNVFDELVRVPLILRGPGLPAGRRLSGPVQLEDLAPTILTLLGVGGGASLDGVDLVPWLRGESAASPRAFALGRRRPHPGMTDLFFVRRFPEKWQGRPEQTGRAFDLEKDPGERAGRAGSAAPTALAESLERGTSEAARGIDPDPELKRALEALGYAD